MMQERGVFVDHSTVHRWALKILPVMAHIFRRRKRPVGTSLRMDETYIKVAGQWKYLYRAVDKSGDTEDFLLTDKRDLAAARRYIERTINLHGLPEKILHRGMLEGLILRGLARVMHNCCNFQVCKVCATGCEYVCLSESAGS
jgi:transposase-like protein